MLDARDELVVFRVELIVSVLLANEDDVVVRVVFVVVIDAARD
jgi:hypothetical protein